MAVKPLSVSLGGAASSADLGERVLELKYIYIYIYIYIFFCYQHAKNREPKGSPSKKTCFSCDTVKVRRVPKALSTKYGWKHTIWPS